MEFIYSGLDSSGQETKGTLLAPDQLDALGKLKSRGLTVVDLYEKKSRERKPFSLRKGLTDQDIYNLTKELSILLRSGIRIDKAFEMLIPPSAKEELKDILSRILTDIKAGKGVAQAFSQTDRFSPLVITMINVGEATGELSSAFENLSQYLRFQIQFKAEVRNAMTYPLFLTAISLLTLIGIFNFVIPRFFSIFGTNISSLPLITRILYNLSQWLSFRYLALGAGLIMALFLIKKFYPSRLKIPPLNTYLVRLPLVGKLILHLELSRFSYSMYSMLQSGVEFIKALKLSAALIQNSTLRNPIEALVEQIKEGKKIADVFSQVHFLPELFPNLLRVGEGSGNLKEIFFELFQVYDERFKNGMKRALVLLEPIIIVLMGGIVGFIVISLILTVMSVSSIKL